MKEIAARNGLQSKKVALLKSKATCFLRGLSSVCRSDSVRTPHSKAKSSSNRLQNACKVEILASSKLLIARASIECSEPACWASLDFRSFKFFLTLSLSSSAADLVKVTARILSTGIFSSTINLSIILQRV